MTTVTYPTRVALWERSILNEELLKKKKGSKIESSLNRYIFAAINLMSGSAVYEHLKETEKTCMEGNRVVRGQFF